MMTHDEVKAIDAAWFKKHGPAAQLVRHAFSLERQQAIADDPRFGTRLVLVVVTQVSPGRLSHKMICVLDDTIAGYLARNGLDSLGISDGQLCIPVSGCAVMLQ